MKNKLRKSPTQAFYGIAFAVMFALAGVLLVVISRAATPGSITITPSTTSAALGSTITVKVSEDSVTSAVNAIQADIGYDPSRLQYVSTDISTPASDFNEVAQNKFSAGLVNLALGSDTPLTGKHAVATLTFKVVAIGNAAVTVETSSQLITSDNTTNILSNVNNATIAIIDTVAPTAVLGLSSTTQTTNAIALTWNAATDNVKVAGYNIYRNGVKIGSSDTNTYNDTNLKSSTIYNYTVAAYDAAGNVAPQSGTVAVSTKTDIVLPTVPGSLKLVSNVDSNVTFSWTPSVATAQIAGYNIYRNGVKIASTNATSYTDYGLTGGASYVYNISSYDYKGNVSAQSAGLPVVASNPPGPRPGDVNGDGKVNIFDLGIMSTNWGKRVAAGTNGDLNKDGIVNIFDLSILCTNWGK